MEPKLTKILAKAKLEPEEDLAEKIWHDLVARERYITKIKLWAFGFIGFSSLAGLVPAFKILFDNLTQSGFYEYFSLIFSDSGSVVAYWKELV